MPEEETKCKEVAQAQIPKGISLQPKEGEKPILMIMATR